MKILLINAYCNFVKGILYRIHT